LIIDRIGGAHIGLPAPQSRQQQRKQFQEVLQPEAQASQLMRG
jgi:hypothetical protein